MINNNYNHNDSIALIGAGPSSIFAAITLVRKFYNGAIYIIDKGKSLENRPSTEVINGMAGAGAFSDSKLTLGEDVGGNIPNLSSEELELYGDKVLSILNGFYNLTNKGGLSWDIPSKFDTRDSDLKWDNHKTLHLGTEKGRELYFEIEKSVKRCPKIQFLFETEVLDVDKSGNKFSLKLKDKEKEFFLEVNKVVLATGQKNSLPNNLMKKFNLTTTPRALQLGVRVEDTINPQYKDIIKANYDFKFVKTYSYPETNTSVRVRTFCCNSGNAHVCAENANEGFVCFNGHAFKTPDPNNNSVNYGIMCEVKGPEGFIEKEDQVNLMKRVNSILSWKEDNFTYGEVIPKRKLLEGFPQLEGIYPKEVIESLNKFIQSLNSLVNLENAHYLYPEIKLSGYTPKLTDRFETEVEGLFMIGDCALTRGITKAAITGIILGENI